MGDREGEAVQQNVLFNSAALHALKRHQLVSLSKRYGLKASGKNVEMVARLEAHANTFTPRKGLDVALPTATPAAGTLLSDEVSEPPTPMPTPLFKLFNTQALRTRTSDQWEVLTDSGASIISPSEAKEAVEMTQSGSIRSWKSANNGEALSEFDTDVHAGSTSRGTKTGSFRALADSLKRSVSRDWLSKVESTSAESPWPAPTVTILSASESPVPAMEREDPEEVVVDSQTASPASTIGVPRRHSALSLLDRPSTVRLCSPTQDGVRAGREESEDLPFTRLANIKARRSMAPLRSSTSQQSGSSFTMSRKSMSALPSSTSASLRSIYPPLPSLPTPSAFPPLPPLPTNDTMPGAFPSGESVEGAEAVLPPTPVVTFGSGPGISNAQFSSAAAQMLTDLNARLPQGSARFGEELLKGKDAELNKLVDFNDKLGEGGWGMKGSCSQQDRYAKVHEREFAKMKSISSGLNASAPAPYQAPTPLKRKHSASCSSLYRDVQESKASAPHASKKSRLLLDASQTLRQESASRPIVSVTAAHKSPVKAMFNRNKQRDTLFKRATFALLRKPATAISSSTAVAPSSLVAPVKSSATTLEEKADNASIAESTMTAASSFVVTEPTMLRRRSIGPQETLQRHGVLVPDSLKRSATTIRRLSQDLSAVLKRQPDVLVQSKDAAPGKDRPSRQASETTQASAVPGFTVSTTSSSRGVIPDFGAPSRLATSRQVDSLGLPRATSSTWGSSSRKQGQADMARSARQAPLPPTGTKQSGLPIPAPRSNPMLASTLSMQPSASRLFQPTASSLAKAQPAKPRGARPLPKAPVARQISTASNLSIANADAAPPSTTTAPFGTVSTRSQLFESNFLNVSRPTAPLVSSSKIPKSKIGAPTPLRPKLSVPLRNTPGKGTPSSSRIRKQASGIQAIKSHRRIHEEAEVQRKREAIRAKQGRRAEERELRAMLG